MRRHVGDRSSVYCRTMKNSFVFSLIAHVTCGFICVFLSWWHVPSFQIQLNQNAASSGVMVDIAHIKENLKETSKSSRIDAQKTKATDVISSAKSQSHALAPKLPQLRVKKTSHEVKEKNNPPSKNAINAPQKEQKKDEMNELLGRVTHKHKEHDGDVSATRKALDHLIQAQSKKQSHAIAVSKNNQSEGKSGAGFGNDENRLNAQDFNDLQKAFAVCWHVPAVSAEFLRGLVVDIEVTINSNGTTQQAKILSTGTVMHPYYNLIAESALAAFQHPHCMRLPVRSEILSRHQKFQFVFRFRPDAIS